MTRSFYAITTCFAALLATSQANAMQLTNRDTADYKLVLTERDTTQEMIVKPSEILDSICLKGCTIKMPDGEEYEFDGNEVVSIEEGLMFLDDPSDSGPADVGSGTPVDSESAEPDKKDQ